MESVSGGTDTCSTLPGVPQSIHESCFFQGPAHDKIHAGQDMRPHGAPVSAWGADSNCFFRGRVPREKQLVPGRTCACTAHHCLPALAGSRPLCERVRGVSQGLCRSGGAGPAYPGGIRSPLEYLKDAAPGPGSPGSGPGSRTACRCSHRSAGPRSSCPGPCCRTWGISR